MHRAIAPATEMPFPPAGGLPANEDDGWPVTEPAAQRAIVERRLDELVPARDRAPVVDAMRHALLGPGKRLRARLAMTAARALGHDPRALLDAGCALEMLHAASLILDDLPCMDDATLRRGRPATHVAHGEDVAILASIGLLARAFGLIATQGGACDGVRARLCAQFAQHVGIDGLVGGQFDDLHRGRHEADAEGAERCNLRKTSALFLAAVEAAGACAGADSMRQAQLRDFALHLGGAFQIADDLLDATTSAVQAGKDTGKDAGKPTIVTLLGLAGARRAMHAHLAAALRAACAVDAGIGRLGAPEPDATMQRLAMLAPPPGDADWAEDGLRAGGPLTQYLLAAFGDELRAAIGH